jgi:hypothetical protein
LNGHQQTKKEHSLHCVLEFASPAVCAEICYPPHFMDLMDQKDQVDKNMRPESKGVHFVHWVHFWSFAGHCFGIFTNGTFTLILSF